MALNIKHIETFLAVAELGTFRRAAAHLHTTQPNISGRIAQLERHLGVSLMERDAGSVRLTPKGQSLLAPARAVLGAMDGFIAAADDEALFQGILRLGVSEMVAHTWLRPFLMAMKDRFPNVLVELTVDLSANLSRALFAHDLDLAFQSGPFDRKSRGSLALGQSPYVWVAAPSIGETGACTVADITRHPILTHARGTAPYRQLEEHFRAQRVAARLVPSSNIAACLQMTQDGLGIACLPKAMLETLLSSGKLRELAYPWRPDALRFEARYNMDPVPTYISEAAVLAQRLSPPEDKKK